MVWILGVKRDPASGGAVVKLSVAKMGLLLAVTFLIYASYFLFLAYRGEGQATIFISLATLPFSIGVNIFCDWLQDAMHLTNRLAYVLEITITCLVGMAEFYAIGVIIEHIFRRRRNSG